MSKHVRMAGLALGIAALGAMARVANAAADLSVSPVTQTIAPGKDFSVDVNISNVSDLYGYQFDLTFNPKLVEALSSSEGSFLSKGGSTYFIPGSNDNVSGSVGATADTLISATSGVTGTGTLAVFTFEALKTGGQPDRALRGHLARFQPQCDQQHEHRRLCDREFRCHKSAGDGCGFGCRRTYLADWKCHRVTGPASRAVSVRTRYKIHLQRHG